MTDEKRMKRLELIKKMKLRITDEDIIAAILFHVKEDIFSGDVELIHRAIKDCKDRNEYATYFNDFSFTKDRTFPRSKLLDNIFKNLQNSNYIGMNNPKYGEYFFCKDAKKTLEERILTKFDEEALENLKEMGEIFNSYVEINK